MMTMPVTVAWWCDDVTMPVTVAWWCDVTMSVTVSWWCDDDDNAGDSVMVV